MKRAQQIAFQHQQREEAFRRSKDELNEDLRNYRAEGAQLRRAIVQQGDVQKNEFLRGFLIRDSYKKIAGMTDFACDALGIVRSRVGVRR